MPKVPEIPAHVSDTLRMVPAVWREMRWWRCWGFADARMPEACEWPGQHRPG